MNQFRKMALVEKYAKVLARKDGEYLDFLDPSDDMCMKCTDYLMEAEGIFDHYGSCDAFEQFLEGQ